MLRLVAWLVARSSLQHASDQCFHFIRSSVCSDLCCSSSVGALNNHLPFCISPRHSPGYTVTREFFYMQACNADIGIAWSTEQHKEGGQERKKRAQDKMAHRPAARAAQRPAQERDSNGKTGKKAGSDKDVQLVPVVGVDAVVVKAWVAGHQRVLHGSRVQVQQKLRCETRRRDWQIQIRAQGY